MASVDPNPSDVEIAQHLMDVQSKITDIKAESQTRGDLLARAMERPIDPAWQGETLDEIEKVSNSAPNFIVGVGQTLGSYAVSALLVAQWATAGPEVAGTTEAAVQALSGPFGIFNAAFTSVAGVSMVIRTHRAKTAKQEIQARVERFETEYTADKSAGLDARIALAGLETESAELKSALARQLGIPNDWRVIERAQTIAAAAERVALTESIKATLLNEQTSAPTPDGPTIEPVPKQNPGVRFGIG